MPAGIFPVRDMKRTRLVVALAAAVMLGLLAAVILRPREPRYEGRTLTEWVSDGTDSTGDRYATDNNAMVQIVVRDVGGTNAPKWQKANHAVRQMGPKVIPWLLKWFEADDPPVKIRVIGWLEAHPAVHLHITSSGYRNVLADAGFHLLGSGGEYP